MMMMLPGTKISHSRKLDTFSFLDLGAALSSIIKALLKNAPPSCIVARFPIEVKRDYSWSFEVVRSISSVTECLGACSSLGTGFSSETNWKMKRFPYYYNGKSLTVSAHLKRPRVGLDNFSQLKLSAVRRASTKNIWLRW